MKQLKILFSACDNIPHIGGKSTHIIDLMDGMKKNGHEVFLVSNRDVPKIMELSMKCILSPYRLMKRSLYIYYYSKLNNLILGSIIRRRCKKNQVEIISAQDAIVANACRSASELLQIPVVMTMHTYFALENTLDNSSIKLGSSIDKKILKNELESLGVAKAVISVDSRIKEHIHHFICQVKSFNDIKLSSIPNFTNIDKFTPATTERKRSLRAEYGFDDDCFVVVCSRRLVEKNGVIYAVKAMSHLPEKSKILLVIAGEGIQRDTIEAYIAEHNLHHRIRILGSIDNDKIVEVYHLSDASIVPSITVNGLQEATSISAIESMACGLPIVASNIGGLKELILEGETGFLIQEQDDKMIAEKLLLLEQDEIIYTNVSKNTVKYIQEYHSHVTAAQKYMDIYQAVVAR